MSDLRIANRYAKSILDLAAEQNTLSQVSNDIEYLRNAFESRDLYNLIKSPIINKGKKIDIFSKLFSGKLSELTQLFLTRVIKKGREDIIPEMVQAFNNQYNEQQGITDVTLTTVSNLSQQAMQAIKARVAGLVGENKDINLEIRHDDSLIGGFVVEYEDKRFDASVKHQLEKIKKSFSA